MRVSHSSGVPKLSSERSRERQLVAGEAEVAEDQLVVREAAVEERLEPAVVLHAVGQGVADEADVVALVQLQRLGRRRPAHSQVATSETSAAVTVRCVRIDRSLRSSELFVRVARASDPHEVRARRRVIPAERRPCKGFRSQYPRRVRRVETMTELSRDSSRVATRTALRRLPARLAGGLVRRVLRHQPLNHLRRLDAGQPLVEALVADT